MNELVTILFTIILQTEACHVPDIEVTCKEYRIDKDIVQVCETEYKKTEYEIVIQEDHVLELWESYHSGMRPSFKRSQASGVWKNIYIGSITGVPKEPKYCTTPKLNSNRHQ